MTLEALVRAVHIAMYGDKGIDHDFHATWCIPFAKRLLEALS
jgi:hypothetical protein